MLTINLKRNEKLIVRIVTTVSKKQAGLKSFSEIMRVDGNTAT